MTSTISRLTRRVALAGAHEIADIAPKEQPLILDRVT